MKHTFTFLVIMVVTTLLAIGQSADFKNLEKYSKTRLERHLKELKPVDKPDLHGHFFPENRNFTQGSWLKSAQAVKQRLDSLSYQAMEEKGKFEFVYDVNGMLTHERKYYWEETRQRWFLISVSETTYDAGKNPIQYVNTYPDAITKQFIINHKTTFSYDNNGNVIQKNCYDLNYDHILIQVSKSNYSYDTSGKLIQKISSRFDENINQFVFSDKTDYIYNGNGQESQQICYEWASYSTKQWEPQTKTESTYDSLGYLILLQESNRNNFNNTLIWISNSKEEYTYDPKGRLTQILKYNIVYYDQWKWKLDKDVYVYDDNGNNTQSFYYYNLDVQTNQWMDIYKNEYSYDNKYTKNDLIVPFDWFGDEIFTHMLTEMKIFSWNPFTNDWVTKYNASMVYSPQIITAVTQLNAELVSVYPNPFSESVSVSFPDSYSQISFELFDLQGRKLLSNAIDNNEKVSMEGLNSGIYIYTLNMNGKVQSGKLVKE